MSLRWRMTLWSTIVFAVFLTVLGVIAVFSVRYFFIQRVDENLDRQTSGSLLTFLQRQDANLGQLGKANRPDIVFYTVFRQDGTIYSQDREVPINADQVTQVLDSGQVSTFYQSLPDGSSMRVMLKPIFYGYDGPIIGVLQAATPLAFVDQILNEMMMLLGGSSVVLLVLGAIGAYLLTGRAFRAVGQVTRKVQHIELSQDLSQRLPETGPNDEISTLVTTFNRLLARLQAAFETQRRFVADSSHELRTPLTVIRSNLHLLRQTNDPGERTELLDITEGEVQRLNRMVNDLLYIAQMQAGHDLKPVLRPVELDSLILDVFARARPLAAAKHQKLTLLHEDIAVAMGDRDQLHHLLLNLLDNAMKYTQQGGIISLGLWVDGEWARIEVADNGPGIATSELPHIFDRFFRTQDARQTLHHGSGLGLSIVKSIAEAHGGRIEVYSKLGEGTTFRFWLRMVDSPRERGFDSEMPELGAGEPVLVALNSGAAAGAIDLTESGPTDNEEIHA